MNRRAIMIGILFAGLLVTSMLWAGESAFFRIIGPSGTRITNLSMDGTLVWTNGVPGTNSLLIQRTSDLRDPDAWKDFVQVEDSEETDAVRLFDQEAPDGMVFIPGGINSGVDPDDGPYLLQVEPFYMDENLVDASLWNEVRSWAVDRGYSFHGSVFAKATNHPVVRVRWHDVVKWCNARSEKNGLTPLYRVDGEVYRSGIENIVRRIPGVGYRLPTDMEWEFAARGGLRGMRFPWGNDINHDYANYRAGGMYEYDTSGYADFTYHPSYYDGDLPYTSPVGDFPPNNYGLYDMAGNVLQWCYDWHPNHIGAQRVLRGSFYDSNASNVRLHRRSFNQPESIGNFWGFRTVLSHSSERTRFIGLSGNLNFGELTIGDEVTQDLIIENYGNQELTVSGINLPDGFYGDWSGVIASSNTQVVGITFSPELEQDYEGMLAVDSDATALGGAGMYPVSGVGISPPEGTISLDGDLDFGGVIVGQETSRTLVIANVGGSDLVVEEINLPEAFSGNWSGTIEPFSEQEVIITFEPESAQTYSGDLMVDIGEMPGENTAFIHGYGIPLDVPSGMVFIPGGANTGVDPDYGDYDLSVNSFYMGEHLVTKGLWDSVYEWALENGYDFGEYWYGLPTGRGNAPNHPVHSISWYDVLKWCNARSEMEGFTPVYEVDGEVYRTNVAVNIVQTMASGYRLPTNPEWEYAARGGARGLRFPWGNQINHDYANYLANGLAWEYDVSAYLTDTYHPDYNTGGNPSGNAVYTSPVGSFAPNGYGLYDVIGNVSEWIFAPIWGQSLRSDFRGGTGGQMLAYAVLGTRGTAAWGRLYL